MRTLFIFIALLSMLTSCASKPPDNQQNICKIFKEKSSWYRLVNKSEEKWGAPIHIQMSILRQESSFQNRVKPEREMLFGVIPWKRKSSALGYTQAIDGTWDWYKKENNKPLASRVNFADAVDFDKQVRNISRKEDEQLYSHRSCKPLDEVEFDKKETDKQLDMFNNECEGMCGV